MTKQDIRDIIKAKKRELSNHEINHLSDVITKRFLKEYAYHHCDILFCYMSFNQEVITANIIQNALESGKIVAIPKVMGDVIRFFEIKSTSGLKPGTLGILEPELGDEVIPLVENKNLMIVPGLAFDNEKNRIGYGKGYYDRYFNQYKQISYEKIAFAYDFQIFETIPNDQMDIKIDRIITPTKIII
jgi:5-formyltetrahydrofolate cyclo-ligase